MAAMRVAGEKHLFCLLSNALSSALTARLYPRVKQLLTGLFAFVDRIQLMALWLDTGAVERDDGIVLDIQEVGGLQVGVAIFHARIQGRGVDLHFHPGARRVSLVKNEGAVDGLEVALDRRKHHVFACELNQ